MNSESETNAMAVIGIIAVVPLSLLWIGFVLSILWGWFAVPMGVAPLGVVHAAGLLTLARLIAPGRTRVGEAEPGDLTNAIVTAVAWPAVMLAAGFILHLFM